MSKNKPINKSSEEILKGIGKRLDNQKVSSQNNRGQKVRAQKNNKTPPKTLLKDIKLETNYSKVDNDIFDYLLPKLSIKEQIIYLRMYTEALKENKLVVQLSNSHLQDLCNLSHQSIRSGINDLIEKGLLKKVKLSTNKKPPVFKVFVPKEVLNLESRTTYTRIQNS